MGITNVWLANKYILKNSDIKLILLLYSILLSMPKYGILNTRCYVIRYDADGDGGPHQVGVAYFGWVSAVVARDRR